MKKNKEFHLQIGIIIATFVMIILRFLLNENGRVSPDSIRFFRTSTVFPVIDNTTAPLGYPISLKFFTIFGFDEFWASKIIGILAYLFIIYFAWKKNFYFKEVILTCALFSYVSIFSYSMSEPLILPFVFLFLYISKQIITQKLENWKAVFHLSLMLILLYNIRYSALFFIAGCFGFALLNFKKNYAKTFIISSGFGLVYVVLYKFLFINYYNENYLDQFLEIGLKPTSQLLMELFQGLATSFNPFVHIANPNGGILNIGIYGIGIFNVLFMTYLFIKQKRVEAEKFFIFICIFCIACSYFIQYFYSVNALDYRLLTPFIFAIWLVQFKKMGEIFGKYVYGITFLSLVTGFAFTWLSKGNYLKNRKEISHFVKKEFKKGDPIKFYVKNSSNVNEIQIAELISTVHSPVYISNIAKDTLKTGTLTEYKVLQKIKINKNKFQ